MTDLDELEKLEQAADLDDEIFERREMHITCASSPTFPTLTASGNRVAKYLEAALNALPALIAELRELRKFHVQCESDAYAMLEKENAELQKQINWRVSEGGGFRRQRDDAWKKLDELKAENARLESEIYSLNCRVAELKRGAA